VEELKLSHVPLGEVVYGVRMLPDQASNKPTVVFLHGFLGSGLCFVPLLKRLKGSINPILIDLAGHGETQFPNNAGRYHLHQQLADLKNLIPQLTSSEYSLYGYSMGGRLALRHALEQPSKLLSLILESTSPGISGISVARVRLLEDQQRAQDVISDYPGFLAQWNTMPMFKGGNPDPQEAEDYLRIQKEQIPQGIANSLVGFSAALMPMVRDQLKHLTIPVSLITGSYDLNYVSSSKVMANKITNVKTFTIENAAHRVHLDAPQQVADILSSFLES
jgi:2-succinyl-6-hydroxy-2,4-cyclohexadiene-1-carboxylate synthase